MATTPVSQTQPPTAIQAADDRGDPARPPDPRLRCRVRLADGRLFAGELPPEAHRALHLGLLHGSSDGLVELTPGTRYPDGRLTVDRRNRPEHFLVGGGSGRPGWLRALTEHAARIVAGEYTRPGEGGSEEAFVGAAPRTRPRGGKDAVAHTHFLWVDVDHPGQLHHLWELLAERPCHLLIETAGSGGVHAYWKLAEPLPATIVDRRTGELREPIEQANLRLIHRLGTGPDGKPNVADPQCKERARILRLAGTINHKRGQYARIIDADFALPGYRVADLVGGLPDPEPAAPASRTRRHDACDDYADPYKRISPPEYFQKLAGIEVPRGGLVCCPAHDDRHPSCSVGTEPSQGWKCHAASCGAGGAIYDLASVVLGGPHGRELRGDAFRRAKAYVTDAFGTVTRPGSR
jgi:hypothetical protein